MKNYAESPEYRAYMAKFDYIFEKDYYVDTEAIEFTEFLKLLVENFRHKYNVSKNFSHDVRCQQIHLLKNGKELYRQRLAWGIMPFFQYIRHSNGKDYFICGHDLLDYTIYNISDDFVGRFVSECVVNDDTEEPCDNDFWYIKNWMYNPANNLVTINGQDAMNCSTVTLCDFSDPDHIPLKFRNLSGMSAEKQGDPPCVALRWSKENSLELEAGEENPVKMTLTEAEIRTLLREK